MARLAWPIAVSMLSYSIMTLTDTLFVSRLGASALAGVGLGGVASFTVLCFGFGYLRGVKVVVSQAVGANRRGDIPVWLTGGVIYAAGLGVVMVALGVLLAEHIHRLTESAAAARDAESYLRIRMLGAPVMMLFVALREYRYGVGDMRAPMVATVVGNVVNVGLDYVFIVLLDGGVAGAASASLVGHSMELVVLVALSRKELRFRLPSRAQMAELMRLGLPTGLQFWLEVGSFGLLTVIIASFGDTQLAAHQVTLQVAHLSFLPTAALAEAGSVLAGQAVGAGQVRLVRKVARYAAVGSMGYAAFCTVAYLGLAPWIASAFTAEHELHAAIVQLIMVAALFQLSDAAAVVARGVLRGTGDVSYPAAVGIVTAWVCTPPMAWFLGHGLGLGAVGGWIGLSVEITLAAALFWWRLERAGWLPMAKLARQKMRLAPVLA